MKTCSFAILITVFLSDYVPGQPPVLNRGNKDSLDGHAKALQMVDSMGGGKQVEFDTAYANQPRKKASQDTIRYKIKEKDF